MARANVSGSMLSPEAGSSKIAARLAQTREDPMPSAIRGIMPAYGRTKDIREQR
jgi:hypothetical protein